MNNRMIKTLLDELYKNKNNVIIDRQLINDMSFISPILETFHMQEVYLVTTNDDYLCGIRANHFSVEFGYSELGTDDNQSVILITGNHKGNRCLTLMKVG